MPPLGPRQLLEQVLRAIADSGWRTIALTTSKPFHLRIYDTDDMGFGVAIYIWNCTHGGGSARASDEFRVQLTGVIPKKFPDEVTLLLGWHSGYEVFVGFDIKRHANQSSQSPSIQVKEQTLLDAHTHAFSIHRRQNGEMAVAFRPEFFVDYARHAEELHLTGTAARDMALLNHVDELTDHEISTVRNVERKTVLSQISRKYRASDFRKRVLGAYNHRCAFCGIQLDLIDAAHIIPVPMPSSTDETKNGIALCKLHHSAFDKNLISFNERYQIEVGETEIDRLREQDRLAGLESFKQGLRRAIILPNARQDYPPRTYIAEARKVRRWRLGG